MLPPARCLALLLAATALAACAGKGRPRADAAGPLPDAPPATAAAEAGGDPCALVYEHDEADYTPGGLYRPGQRDHAPDGRPDLDRIPEPVPRAEPPSRYGNRPVYSVLGRQYRVLADVRGYRERGLASWYGAKFHGRATSSMEPYDMCAFTAAHKTLPLPSYARVTHLGNGRSVVVRVNDRGPFHDGRIIDLSYVAALKLGVYETGTAMVEVEAIAPDGPVLLPPPAAGPTTVWLQLGAFGERRNAQALVARLREAGEPARLVEPQAGEARLYRVRAGPFTGASVEEAKARLRILGLPATPIVIGN